MPETFDIPNFRGRPWLSNFYPAAVSMKGHVYPSVENAYQAAKTLDETLRQPFEHYSSRDAKRHGRSLPMRSDWAEIKLPLMHALVRAKFHHPRLGEWLLATGEATIAEGNWWGDTFWGVCNGIGENHLGKILMLVRSELRQDRA